MIFERALIMWQFNPYAIPLFIGVIPVTAIALSMWQHRKNPAARYLFLFTIASASFMLTYGLELVSSTLPLMLTWLKLEYVSSVTIPVFWLLFNLAYSGYDSWLTKRNIVLLFVIPALHLLAVWTNEYHGLNWQTVSTDTVGSLVLFHRTYGLMFYLGTSYLYLIAVLATIIMIMWLRRAPNLYRSQIASLIFANFVFAASHILTISGLTIFDITPFGSGLACIPLAWSLFHDRLLDIMPAARGAIIKGMSDAIIVLDQRNRLVDINPAAAALIGVDPDAVLGKPVDNVITQSPELVERYRNVHEAQGELVFGSGDEKQFFDLRISPLYDRNQQLTGRIVVLRDVTRSKRAEATIRQYATELEERNRELDAFSHTIAHDLRTPITSIMGYTEMVEMFEGSTLSTEGRKYLTKIQNAAAKMADMTTELLQLASLRDINTVLTSVDTTSVAHAAVDRFRSDIDKRTIQIEVMPNMPHALGQAMWLEEVFANLIGNAVKYIGKDNPCPRISIRGFKHENKVRFEVQDNGLGISEEDQAKLFDMFTRFHTGEASGLGLGLSIFLRIVNRLNGQVGVESSPGKGSIFWFTLPVPIA